MPGFSVTLALPATAMPPTYVPGLRVMVELPPMLMAEKERPGTGTSGSEASGSAVGTDFVFTEPFTLALPVTLTPGAPPTAMVVALTLALLLTVMAAELVEFTTTAPLLLPMFSLPLPVTLSAAAEGSSSKIAMFWFCQTTPTDEVELDEDELWAELVETDDVEEEVELDEDDPTDEALVEDVPVTLEIEDEVGVLEDVAVLEADEVTEEATLEAGIDEEATEDDGIEDDVATLDVDDVLEVDDVEVLEELDVLETEEATEDEATDEDVLPAGSISEATMAPSVRMSIER